MKDVVDIDVVKKTVYDKVRIISTGRLVAKNTVWFRPAMSSDIDSRCWQKMPNTNVLVKKTDYNTKIPRLKTRCRVLLD